MALPKGVPSSAATETGGQDGFNQNPYFMLSVRKVKLGCHWSLQQDNEPKPFFSTKPWFQKKSWKITEWPSQSPDMNPTVKTKNRIGFEEDR